MNTHYLYTQFRSCISLIVIFLSPLIINCLMFNPSPNSAFASISKPEANTDPKPQTLLSPPDKPKEPQATKTKNIVIKSTSNAGMPEGGKKPQPPKVSAPEVTLLQPQENRATGGGILQPNRLNGNPLNNAANDAPEVPEREEEQPLSAFSQLKNRLFMYTKLQKRTFEKKDSQELLKTFKMLTSNEKARSEILEELKTPQGREAKIDINYLRDLKDKEISWAKHYFYMVIYQLMSESKFLSFEWALQLVIQYLQINKEHFWLQKKFNLTVIIEGCKIKIRNEISQGSISSIKNQPYFKKMVKEISFVKDIIFLQLGNFFKALRASHEGEEGNCFPRNKWIESEQFNKELGKIMWGSFKNIIDSQKKEVKNAFELKILLNALNTILRVSPKAFSEEIAMKSVLPTFVEYSKLIEVTANLKSLADEFMLHLLLTHPYTPSTCVKPLTYLRNNNHYKYDYLSLLSERPMRFDKRPMTNFQTAIFIENVLQIDDDYSNFSPRQDQFIFKSIYNIIKDNPQRFWTDHSQYTHIFRYIQYLAEEVEVFADQHQDINAVYNQQLHQLYIKISQFAEVIGLLIFPSYSQSISRQRMERLFKNKYVINDFLKVAMRMIVQCKRQEDDKYIYEQVDIQPIYDFLFQLIIHDHSIYLNAKTTLLRSCNDYDLQIELFPNYLTKYVQRNTYSANCILALTKLVQLQCNQEIIQIMFYFNQLNHPSQEFLLSQIISELFKKDENLRPLAKFVLCLLKYFPNFDNHPIMDCMLREFKELPERAHPENNTAYAAILEVSLKFVQVNPSSMAAVQQYFDFKFANQYICTALDASFQDGIFNKHMRGTVYQPVATAVKLLKTMTELYLHEKSSNEGELVPYEIRKLLQAQNKEGDYQITMRSKALKQYATSYHLVLLAVLLSRELNFDFGLKAQYPNLKNDVLETLINLNRIHIHLKHQINLKVSIFYDKQLEGEVNRRLNVKGEVFDAIVNDPTYLGLEYLISSGSIDFKQKKVMFDRVKEIQLERSTSNMRGKSHFIIVYWKEIQNSKLNIDAKKGWDYVKREVKEVLSFLQSKEIGALPREERDGVAQILDNLYSFSDVLRESNKEYYIKYFLMIHRIYFDTEFACFNLLNEEHTNSERSKYRTSLLLLFSCRSFVSNPQFDTLSRETEMHDMLYRFLRDLLKITYRKNYSVGNDLRILEIVEFGLSFLIDIGQVSREWLEELRRLLMERPQKHSPMLTKEVIILVLLHGRLGENMECERVDFGNRDWLLMMNAVEPSARYGTMLVGELMTIYEMHPIFFASACHYLASTSATPCLEQFYEINSIRGSKKSVDCLIDILKKAIQSEKPYYCVWIIQILTEMLMNKSVSKNNRVKYCSQIRAKILTQLSLHQRIAELLAKVGCPYSQSYANLWKPCQLRKPVDSAILFAEKQELLAYLRLLTFIYFTKEQEKSDLEETLKKQCNNVEKEMLVSFLALLPMISSLLKDDGEKETITAGSQWQTKLKRLDLTRIEFSSVKSSGLRQLSSDKLSQVWKGRSGLQILHEVSNIQLASVWAMWISVLRQQSYIVSIFLDSVDSLEHYFQILIKFLQALKKKMTSLQEGINQIDKVLNYLKEKVYSNSVIVSKEMLFTNASSRSSCLPLQYESVKGRLRQNFEFIYVLIKEVFKLCNKEKVRNFQTFEKQFDRFMRSCKDLQTGYFTQAGSLIEISEHENNRNSVTHSRSITNRSHR